MRLLRSLLLRAGGLFGTRRRDEELSAELDAHLQAHIDTGSFVLTRFIASLLFGVNAADPLTFGLVAALLLGVTLGACYLPACRATRVDPLIALRAE